MNNKSALFDGFENLALFMHAYLNAAKGGKGTKGAKDYHMIKLHSI
jgi:hypothetical protein